MPEGKKKKRLQLCAIIKKEVSRKGLETMKGKKLGLRPLYKASVLKNHAVSVTNGMFKSPPPQIHALKL